MPRNGSGGYSLPGGINPVITQTLITSTWANTTLADVAQALTNSLAKDGQTLPTNNLPMGGFRHTGAGAPSLRDQYATLGYVQDGSHYELTSVGGVNAISAVLVGGLTAYSLGMIVQLLPVATSTGPITLNINGIGPVPVVTPVGNQLTAGDLVVGKAYILMFNGTAFELINGGTGAEFAQAAMSGWDRPASGVYPLITQVNPTTINVPAGTGRVIAPSARDSTAVTEVSWAAQNVVLTNLASAWNTIIAVNAAGAIVQYTGNALPGAARANIILGSVTHMNGAIDSIRQRPSIYADMSYGAYDLTQVFCNTLLTGGQITQNATAMHMDMNAGVFFALGGNANQSDNPNLVPFVGQVNFNFYPITANNTVAAVTNVAPVGNYDPAGAGAIVAVPGAANAAVIHRIYMMAGGTMVWLYGQAVYVDQATALREFIYDTQNLKLPSKLLNATLIASIIAAKGTASLANTADCRIIPQGGVSYTIGVAGSISEAPADGSSYGRKNAAWSKVVDAVISGDGITVNSADPNKPIVAVGATMAGPKTITSGDLNLSATTKIVYSNTLMQIIGSTLDGSDNLSISIAGGGFATAARGGYLKMWGNEAVGSPGVAELASGTGADVNVNSGKDINLNTAASGNNVVVPNGYLFLTDTTAVRGIKYSSVDCYIHADTAPAGDSKDIQISGGGGPNTARGAFLTLCGNQHAGFPGIAVLSCGNAANAQVRLAGGDVRIDSGRLFGLALHNNPTALTGPTNQYVGSGTYTPTLTNVANCSALTPTVSQWMRVGNVVTVSGRCDLSCTAGANTQTQLRISLPIASNFTVNSNCGGSFMSSIAGAIEPGTVSPDTVNDAAQVVFFTNSTGSRACIFNFTYLVN